LGRIFAERKQTGGMDLEAVETGFRSVLHQAGAAALTQLLQFPEPADDERSIRCPCGHQPRFRELRSRRLLSALGEVELSRPWYLCPQCHEGQFPADAELDIEHTEFSPGVRRMQALVGQAAPFDPGRQQMKVLAGLEVTANRWSGPRRRLAPTSPKASRAKSAEPSNWTCLSSSASRSHFCMCKWTGPVCRW
jgi:hypothetical protein